MQPNVAIQQSTPAIESLAMKGHLICGWFLGSEWTEQLHRLLEEPGDTATYSNCALEWGWEESKSLPWVLGRCACGWRESPTGAYCQGSPSVVPGPAASAPPGFHKISGGWETHQSTRSTSLAVRVGFPVKLGACVAQWGRGRTSLESPRWQSWSRMRWQSDSITSFLGTVTEEDPWFSNLTAHWNHLEIFLHYGCPVSPQPEI